MRMTVQSQEEFIWSQLVELICQLDDRSEGSYSQMIEFTLQELVRLSMRAIAIDPDYGGKQPLLEQAMQQVQQQLQERLGNRVEFSWSAYSEGLRQSLKYPAREVAELAARRRQWRQQERGNHRTIVQTDAGVTVEIIRVGRAEAVEALLVQPQSQQVEVRLDEFSELYEVEGDWFPFQVTVEELPFVINSDGGIYTCTHNFPASLLEQAQQAIVRLAQLIYRPVKER
ncbi:hypothetical protein IFO70_33605 [Phormidium tenue FACHB-886]|nr:hypothetical protein [Phormidium tenue FACHB-886]